MTRPTDHEFRPFFAEVEPGLRRALVAALGAQKGREATADALAWAWENWSKIQEMQNPTGYLFRVGQSKSRTRKVPMITPVQTWDDPVVEPELPGALMNLTDAQRLAVVLVHAYDWTLREVAELSDTSISTVQTHLERGLAKLRSSLAVDAERHA
jgi:RNA polymerase sigma-70 factor (ECF subfamily)